MLYWYQLIEIVKIQNIKDTNMSLIKDITLQISAYDQLIEKLVDENASDRVIGDLEIKRQKLIQRKKKLEQQQKHLDMNNDGDKDKEIIMLKKQCEMLYDVASELLKVSLCPRCYYDLSMSQQHCVDDISKDKYDNVDLLDELNLI